VLLEKGQMGTGPRKQGVGYGVGEAESGANQEGKTGELLTKMQAGGSQAYGTIYS
jgi:hypothetical protein